MAVFRRPPLPPGSGSDVDVATGEIPEETAGPYPGDGSNGTNVLSESGVVRSDITCSFGDASAVADGVPFTIELTLLDVSGDSSGPLAARPRRGLPQPGPGHERIEQGAHVPARPAGRRGRGRVRG